MPVPRIHCALESNTVFSAADNEWSSAGLVCHSGNQWSLWSYLWRLQMLWVLWGKNASIFQYASFSLSILICLLLAYCVFLSTYDKLTRRQFLFEYQKRLSGGKFRLTLESKKLKASSLMTEQSSLSNTLILILIHSTG